MKCGGNAKLDVCNVCNGPGIAWKKGVCDCKGSKVDACGKCGGPGIPKGCADCKCTKKVPIVPTPKP